MKERNKNQILLTFGSDGMESNGMVANVFRANEIESYLIPLLKRSHSTSYYTASCQIIQWVQVGSLTHTQPNKPTQAQPVANRIMQKRQIDRLHGWNWRFDVKTMTMMTLQYMFPIEERPYLCKFKFTYNNFFSFFVIFSAFSPLSFISNDPHCSNGCPAASKPCEKRSRQH